MQFGDYLVSRNLVTPEQLDQALEYQRVYNRPLGKFACELGYISRRDNIRILLEQIKTNKPYGEIAMEKGLLTRQQLDEVLAAQSHHSIMIGKILVQKGVLTRTQLIEALKNFHSSEA
jgi:hypothetical protein